MTKYPKDWVVTSLEAIGSIKSGGTPLRSEGAKYFSVDGIPWVKTMDLNNGHIEKTDEKITKLAIKESACSIFPKDTVLVAMYGGFNQIGRTGILTMDAAINQAISAIILKSEVATPEYVIYWLNANVLKWRQFAASSRKDPNITRKDVCEFPIVLPPLLEQCRIAEVLGVWDESIDLLERLIGRVRSRKQGLMQQLLTGKKRFKEFEGSEWGKYKLGRLVTKIGSGITPKGGREVYLDRGIPLIRSQNVLWGKLSLKDVAYISPEQHSKMRNTQLEYNDVLLNITGASIGRSCVFAEIESMANVNQHVCIIRTAENLDPLFLSGYLNSQFGQAQILSFQAGGNREGLNFEQIRNFNIILPPLPEQEKIAAVLSAADEEISTLEKQLAAYKQQKLGLMQQLLTGRIRI